MDPDSSRCPCSRLQGGGNAAFRRPRRREIAIVGTARQRPAFCEDGHMDDTTKTDEAWRDEWCPTCRGNRQHHKGGDGKWRCHYCHTEANAHTARRLDGAESNKRKLDSVTVSK
jgi:tRNA(Ile2) C34 agmatinyltransferase TiaS